MASNNMLGETNSHFSSPNMYLSFSNSPRCGMSTIKYPSLVQHCPQSTKVRFIKDLMGNSISVVYTDELPKSYNYQLMFPPNNYDDAKLRMNSQNFNYSPNLKCKAFVSASPSLDTILSLNYFTRLQNMSFKNKMNFTLKRVPDLEGWEDQLKKLTICALEPLVKDNIESLNISQSVERKRTMSASPIKRLYTSSGRILPEITKSRPRTSPSKRPNSRLLSSRHEHIDSRSDKVDIDSQVFNILGGILQTSENEVIKTWLITATEREKALMVDILRSALSDKEELNIFVKEPVRNNENLILYTPNKNFNPKLTAIPENSKTETSDYLLVHPDLPTKKDILQTRPPTSSTFRPSTSGTNSRPPTRQESTWIPCESIVIS